MGAKSSKAPDSRGQENHNHTGNGPGHRSRTGLAEVGALEPDQGGGWGSKFLDSGMSKLGRVPSAKSTPSSVRSKTSTVAKKSALKVSEVLRGAGTVGLGALDTFSSSVANLNNKGFAIAKGNKIGILAFEVANTIVKGAMLKMSLGEEDIAVLKKEVLVSEGVHRLVSTDSEELLLIAAADKKNELKVYADEVVRFGNLCRDPMWHGYHRVFQSLVKERDIMRLSREEADKIMDDLMNLAQNTADLYHELHALDRFRTDLKRKQQDEQSSGRGGETMALLKSEVKSQEKNVEALKKRSLWSRTLEEVMEHLVDIANYLYQEIHDNFGPRVFLESPEAEEKRNVGKLGTSGLALHYANIIQQIDSLVLRPGSVPPNTRDNLYQGLPPSVKAALKFRLQDSAKGVYDMSLDEVKEDMSNILSWLVPVASNTTKAHHGFGWVGEWANMGSPADRKAMGYVEVSLLQTLHHANQQQVENYILELTILLHRLVTLSVNNNNNITNTNNNNNNNNNINAAEQISPPKPPPPPKPQPTLPEFLIPDRSASPPPFGMYPADMDGYDQGINLTQEDKDMLGNMGSDFTQRRILPGLSKSQEFDNGRVGERGEFLKLSKSSSHSQSSTVEMEAPLYRPRHRVKPLNVHYESDAIDQS